MANKIDITISAKDEASDVIDGVKDSFGELDGSADDLNTNGSKSFGDFMDNVAIAMLGINQAIEVGMKVAEAAKVVYDNTVGKALTVAGEIEELMRVSGDAPETLSALRLEAEKADVPFDDLYKAMQNLNENGIAPTVDNLVAIADEYVNLKDPLEKAKLLTENFGEAGDEIAPMLELIAGGVKEVQDAGQIFTEEEIQAAKDYEAALAELKSANEGFAISIGTAVIPALTDLVDALATLSVDAGGGIGEFLSDSIEGVADLALQFALAKAAIENFKATGGADLGEFVRVMWVAFGSAKTTTEDLITELSHLGYSVGDTEEPIKGATDATEGLSTANLDLVNAQIAAKDAAADLQAQLEAEFNAITSLDNNYKGIIDLAYEYTDILEEITAQEKIMAEEPIGSEKYEEAKGKVEDLKASMTELANRVTLDMFQATIAIGGVTEAELAAYMQMAIDMGLMSEEGAQAAITAYSNAVETINGYAIDEKTGNVVVNAAAAFATLDLLQQYSLLDKEQRVFVKTYYDSGSDNYWEDKAAGGAVHAAASGVAASLPHYWVGELGPEPFFPSVDGRIVSNTQAMSALRGGTNAGDIADAVKKGVKEAMRDGSVGNVYNLTMPTSSNPADIRMAFELMEAWGT